MNQQYCSLDEPIKNVYSRCGDQVFLIASGVYTTDFVTGDANSVLLKSYLPLIFWYDNNFGFVNDVINKLNVSMDCYSNSTQKLTGNYLYVAHIPATKDL